jgi:hypothetical protein
MQSRIICSLLKVLYGFLGVSLVVPFYRWVIASKYGVILLFGETSIFLLVVFLFCLVFAVLWASTRHASYSCMSVVLSLLWSLIRLVYANKLALLWYNFGMLLFLNTFFDKQISVASWKKTLIANGKIAKSSGICLWVHHLLLCQVRFKFLFWFYCFRSVILWLWFCVSILIRSPLI